MLCEPVLRGGDGAADDTACSRDSYLEALLDAESSGEQAHAQSPAPPTTTPHAAHVAPPVSAPHEQQRSSLGTAARVQCAPGERRPSAERASWAEPSTSTSSDLSEDLSEDRGSESGTGEAGETAETTAETADVAAEFVVEDAEQLHAAVIERRRLLHGVKRQLSESRDAAPVAAATNVRPMPPAHACSPACAHSGISREHGICACMYTYVHMYVCMYTYVCMYVCVCMYACV